MIKDLKTLSLLTITDKLDLVTATGLEPRTT